MSDHTPMSPAAPTHPHAPVPTSHPAPANIATAIPTPNTPATPTTAPAPTPATPATPTTAPAPSPGLRHFFAALGLIVAVLGAIVVALLVALRVLGWQPDRGLLAAGLLATLTLLAAGLLWMVVKRSRTLTAASLGFSRPSWRLLHLLWQIPVVMLGAVAVSGLAAVLFFAGAGTSDVESTVGNLQDMGGGVLALLALLLLGAVITPLWEEVLFRGILFQALAKRLPWFAAALIGGAVFAAVHLAPMAIPYVFVIGVAACMLFRFHGNLWAPIILHIVNNSVVILLAASVLLGGGG